MRACYHPEVTRRDGRGHENRLGERLQLDELRSQGTAIECVRTRVADGSTVWARVARNVLRGAASSVTSYKERPAGLASTRLAGDPTHVGIVRRDISPMANSFRAPVRIPPDLVELVADRRVIPFVGAGFSAGLGCPTWEQLLEMAAIELKSDLSFAELMEYTGGDLLQIAEYIFLRCRGTIGPMRHEIERQLKTDIDTMQSAPHVELVNLGAPQIYTTNYDEFIERTYDALGVEAFKITVSRDIAMADPRKPEIVKYHGDLAHEQTLILTESSYYKRLDFESPMDLKFRSDLLGKAVLFMGYSFRDINIRIIWFKLMEMVRDIAEEDRRPSYIVRIESNPVLEALYKSVGLTTIVLDPEGKAETSADRAELLGEFLFDLATEAWGGSGKVPETGQPLFVSKHLIKRMQQVPHFMTPTMLQQFAAREVPPSLADTALEEFHRVARSIAATPFFYDDDSAVRSLVALTRRYGGNNEITNSAIMLYISDSNQGRHLAALSPSDWRLLFSGTASVPTMRQVIGRLEREIDFQEGGTFDEDLAYAVDMTQRLLDNQFGELPSELRDRAVSLLERAEVLYPIIKDDHVRRWPPGQHLKEIIEAISAREKAFSDSRESSSEGDEVEEE